jgi:flagellar hook-associated protein 1 FlgK
LRQSINQNVDADVTEANNLIDDIARLNPRITALESAGLLQSDAGSLRDQRYADLNRLSQLLPVTVNDRGSAGVDVTLNGQALVIPGEVQHLQSVPRADRGMTVHDVTIVGSSTPITGAKGEIPGLVSGRDDVIGGFLDKLDQFTSTIINQVNLIHASGQGAHGYTSVTGTYGIKDPTLALDASGLPFTPQNGSFQVQVINTSTGLAQIATINVDLAGVNPKTTLNGGAGSIVSQLNGVANITASVNGAGELQIDAANGYQIEFSNDNSGTLAALGINTFFTGSNSGDVGVNSMLINDPTMLAAAQGGGPGDATNAVQLANLGNLTPAALGGATISNFYQQTVSSLGSSSASQNAVSQGSQGFLSSLNNQRAQTTGVSLDTETIQIMQYQQAYQSAARLISTIDKLFTTLTQL